MSTKVRRRGRYELFETTEEHRILVLNGRSYYALVEGQRSPVIVHSDSDHERDRTVRKGQFYLVDFEDDPEFRDQPHLFLENDGRFEEMILPNGLPTEKDHQKRLIHADETVAKDRLMRHLTDGGKSGRKKS